MNFLFQFKNLSGGSFDRLHIYIFKLNSSIRSLVVCFRKEKVSKDSN